jgi:hypothetical protein
MRPSSRKVVPASTSPSSVRLPLTPRPSGVADADWQLHLSTLRILAMQHSQSDLVEVQPSPRARAAADTAAAAARLMPADNDDASRLLRATTERIVAPTARSMRLDLGPLAAESSPASTERCSPSTSSLSGLTSGRSTQAAMSARRHDEPPPPQPQQEPLTDAERLLLASTQRILGLRSAREAGGGDGGSAASSGRPQPSASEALWGAPAASPRRRVPPIPAPPPRAGWGGWMSPRRAVVESPRGGAARGAAARYCAGREGSAPAAARAAVEGRSELDLMELGAADLDDSDDPALGA